MRRPPASSGAVQWAYGIFGILFLTMVICFELQIESYRASSDLMEDALAAGNLASAVIDLREYGKTGILQIRDPLDSYRIYREALAVNLGLNGAGEGGNAALISGRVQVESYIVYNVSEGMVTEIRVAGDDTGTRTGRLGEVTTPEGQMVSSTGVYSRISYPVKGWLGTEVTARKGNLAEVVRNP
ncbi:MAG: hypothetical protein K5891_10630 [Lachnospiraceae bacterium]|nr:hypothetical protein [Lachnospiraceae bacterium]